MKAYSSFDQIDSDLKILKLKKQIGEEELKLSLHTLKGGVRSGFSPVSTISAVLGSLVQKAVVAKLLSLLFGYKRVKEVKKD